MNVLAIIPARSGSKGLPDKNLKLLSGLPLIGHTISQAKDSGVFTDVIVSTDSLYYAEVAKGLGAEIPFIRPPELATDTALALDTYQYTLTRLQSEFNRFYDAVFVLQPTSPLRLPIHIQQAAEMLKGPDVDGVVSVCELEHPKSWIFDLPKSNSLGDGLKKKSLPNRQAESTSYRLNGAVFAAKVDAFREQNGFYGPKTYALIMDREFSLDIDDEMDFFLAECLLRRRGEK